jgi:TRAP-type C4-dicarboxylate transport system substrate-binding protein
MKIKALSFLVVLCVLFSVSVSSVFAQRKQVIKIASVAPENTPYGAALNRMAADWATATNGEVEVRIYHNGVAGSEEDIIRKIRLGQLQGGVLTSFGLNIITPEMLTLSTPFTIRNEGELDAVIDGLRPTLEQNIEEKGFVSIAWSKAGWIKIFSKQPVFVPSELKSQKLATNPSEPELTQAFKVMGFNVVNVNLNETLMALNSGMADALYSSPLMVGGLQAFGIAKNMATINICPFVGGMVLSRNAWRAIPDRYKATLMSINKRMEEELNASISGLEEESIRTMNSLGLVINTITPAQEEIWYRETQAGVQSIIGTTFDRATYDQMMVILNDYRSRQ